MLSSVLEIIFCNLNLTAHMDTEWFGTTFSLGKEAFVVSL